MENLEHEEQEILDTVEFQANKLITLLQNSTIPEEVKESLVDLLPSFSFEQIDRLINIFEAKYLDEATQEANNQFEEQIKAVMDEYEKKESEEDEKFLNQITTVAAQNI